MTSTAAESMTSISIAGVGAVATLLILVSVTFFVVRFTRRATDSYSRAIARILLAGTVLLTTTVVLGAFDVIPSRAALFLVTAELAMTVVVLWALVLADAAINEVKWGNERVTWVLIILFTNLVGAILYLALRKPQRQLELGS